MFEWIKEVLQDELRAKQAKASRWVIQVLTAEFADARREMAQEFRRQRDTYKEQKEEEVRAIRINSNEFVVKVVELERRIDTTLREKKVLENVQGLFLQKVLEEYADVHDDDELRVQEFGVRMRNHLDQLTANCREAVGEASPAPAILTGLVDEDGTPQARAADLHDILTSMTGPDARPRENES